MRTHPLLAPAILLVAVSVAGAGGIEKDLPPEMTPDPGKAKVMMASPVNEGTFDGTWMYVNRDAHFAMWIKTEGGKPQMRIQYQSIATPEAFETDWSGKSNYYLSGNPVTFEFKLGESDTNRITGSWLWDFETDLHGRKETADIVLQRTGFGRTMLMAFNNFEKTMRRNGDARVFKLPVAWNWTKISKRELLWNELPW
jgi:hypothetical protein